MFHRFAASAAKVLPASVEVLQSDRDRAAAIVKKARDKLAPFASKADINYNRDGSLMNKMGGPDGLGVLIKLSSYTLNPDGSMSATEFVRFETEGMLLIEGAQSALLNYAVLSSLLMTMFVTLIILHCTRGYEVDGPSGGNVLLGDAARARSIYADVATYAWPLDEAAQVATRRVFHWLECLTLVVGLSCQTFSLLKSTFLYSIISVGLPSIVAKCEYFAGNTLMGDINMCVLGGGVDVLHIIALPWVVARASFVGFITMWASIFVTHMCFGSYTGMSKHGWLNKMLNAQHKEARLALARAAAETVAVRASGGAVTTVVHDLTKAVAEVEPSAAEAELASVLAASLPLAPQQEPHEVIASRMVAEGFTLAALRAACVHGTLSDVVAALSLVPSLGLRAGDRLALAAAVKAAASSG